MRIRQIHPWDISPAEAQALQVELAPLVVTTGEPADVHLVAGIDVALPAGQATAAVVVDAYPELTPIEIRTATLPISFPYIPGLLSFREAPAILAACAQLERRPDLLIVDGQGRAHPRRLGIASHIGLILDLPTIGCAKSLLVGHHGPVGEEVGSWSPIVDRGEVIGAAVRTRRGTRPVYVSIGHRIGLEAAIRWVLNCCRGFRLPDPQRQAHRAAGSR
ncbi:MAG TPA: deoxyribonuclease V [Chloroflexota bacterium]|nr:deoxyribonuclease V [Chloroflexota bacterium]